MATVSSATTIGVRSETRSRSRYASMIPATPLLAPDAAARIGAADRRSRHWIVAVAPLRARCGRSAAPSHGPFCHRLDRDRACRTPDRAATPGPSTTSSDVEH
jgi:hypothetical protein